MFDIRFFIYVIIQLSAYTLYRLPVTHIIVSGDPLTQPGQAGIYDTLAHVQLIQHIPDPPAQAFINDIFDRMFRLPVQKVFDIHDPHRYHAEEGILVYDALIDRGWLQDHHGTVSHIRLILIQTGPRSLGQSIHRKDRYLLPAYDLPISFRQMIHHLRHIDAPYTTVVFFHIFQIILAYGKMQAD